MTQQEFNISTFIITINIYEQRTQVFVFFRLDECGFPTNKFYLLHVSALICIQASIVCGVGVVVASFFFTKDKKGKNFFKWGTSERLVVYLAVCDLLFNVSHTIDHAYIVATEVRSSSSVAVVTTVVVIVADDNDDGDVGVVVAFDITTETIIIILLFCQCVVDDITVIVVVAVTVVLIVFCGRCCYNYPLRTLMILLQGLIIISTSLTSGR